MLITLSSVRGAPGVTSWSMLLAAAWPNDGAAIRCVLEADCDGGVLGARYQLGVEPGAVAFISACRRDLALGPVEQYGAWLTDGLCVIPGPEIGEQALGAWASGASDVARQLVDDPRIWFVDLGRSGRGSPLGPLIDVANLNIVVGGPHLEDLVQLPARLHSLGDRRSSAVLIVGQPECDIDELRRFVAGTTLWLAPAVDQLPLLVTKVLIGGRSRRSPVWRAALAIASELAGMTGNASSSATDSRHELDQQPPRPPIDPRSTGTEQLDDGQPSAASVSAPAAVRRELS